MALINVLTAEPREDAGTEVSRKMRRSGWLPAVVNNEKGKSDLIRLKRHDFEIFLGKHTSENLLVDLSVGSGGSPRRVLLREVQHDPVSGHVLHADFVEISMTKKMRVYIPIVLAGVPAGVQMGGILQQILHRVEVECLPGDLVEIIEVDVSGLGLGDSIQVKDLVVSSAIKVLGDKTLAVASIVIPREEEEAKPEDGEATEAASAEPEVIGEKEREEKRAEKEAGKGGEGSKDSDAKK